MTGMILPIMIQVLNLIQLARVMARFAWFVVVAGIGIRRACDQPNALMISLVMVIIF